MSNQAVNVGVIGCGNILRRYFETVERFDILNVKAVADIDMERAKAAAETYSVKALSVSDLLAADDLEVVVNLTVPQAHAEVSRSIIEAGKSVYSEKPLGLGRAEAADLLFLASARDLRVGCAPDTFLGGGLQTCREVLDAGLIGEPLGATAFVLNRGMEHWHPNPAFFYQRGAGPLFDLGVYYLTALVSLLGPVRQVAGMAAVSFPERTIASGALSGTRFRVETPTFVTGLLDFAAPVKGTILTSFDVSATQLPRIEIYGSDATLSVPDPNTFGGPVRLKRRGEEEWTDLPVTRPHVDILRGIGLADMAYALRSSRPHRASGELALHVLDVMQSILEASEQKQYLELTSSCERPAPLPSGLAEGTLDA